jgi:RNA polymerase sigma-70 factor (ECF subfamily)
VSSSSAFDRLITAGVLLDMSHAKPAQAAAEGSVRELDDETVMRLVQAGDREALGLLFDRYSRLIRSVATRILRDETEAQDLVQDVFLYVHRRSHVFDPTKGSLSSWLVQIAYSRAFTRRQSSARAKADCSRIEELADLGAVNISLERLADTLSARDLVEKALAELSERQQQTLRMYFFEGCSLREISTSLNESFSNTRHHYYRGIERLKAVLKASCSRSVDEGGN